MEANFLRVLPLVLKHEGGFSNHKDDPGGATNKGITLETFRRYVKSDGTVNDLKNITPRQVEQVYNLFYWQAVKADELPGGVDYAVFDFAVNSGPGRAVKFVQKIVGVTQDGGMGPVTLTAIRKMAPTTLVNQLCDNRLTFLKGLKIWATFGKGWGRRVEDVRSHALSMTRGASLSSSIETRPALDVSEAATSVPALSLISASATEAPPPAARSASPAPTDHGAAAKGLVAAALAAIAGGAAYFWDRILNLFGG